MKKISSDLRESLRTKNVRYGSFSAVLTAVVIAIAVLLNLLVSQIPTSFTDLDLSSNRIYTIGEKTEEVLDGLDEDITIQVLQKEENSTEQLNKLLDSYRAASGHIKVKYVDPNVSIDMAQKYSDLTANSLVISSAEAEKTVDYNNIFVTDYSSYYTTGDATTTFNGENLITGAIAYVTSSDLPVMYQVTGHGETSVTSTVSDQISQQNITLKELNLLTTDIPADCAALLINAPTSDFTDAEAAKVLDYLGDGGKAVILTTYTAADLTDFRSILTAYGIDMKDGIAMEGANHYYQQPLYIVPTIDQSESGIGDTLASENANLLMIQAQAFTDGTSAASDGANITYTPLLSTSSDSYLKTVENGSLSSLEKDQGDAEGPFDLAVLSEKTSAVSDGDENTGLVSSDETEESVQGDQGSIIAISASSLIDDSITGMVPSNLEFFGDCLGFLCGGEGSAAVSIDAKDMSDSYITATTGQATVLAFIFIILIPLAIMVTGLIIWLRRRRK